MAYRSTSPLLYLPLPVGENLPHQDQPGAWGRRQGLQTIRMPLTLCGRTTRHQACLPIILMHLFLSYQTRHHTVRRQVLRLQAHHSSTLLLSPGLHHRLSEAINVLRSPQLRVTVQVPRRGFRKTTNALLCNWRFSYGILIKK